MTLPQIALLGAAVNLVVGLGAGSFGHLLLGMALVLCTCVVWLLDGRRP